MCSKELEKWNKAILVMMKLFRQMGFEHNTLWIGVILSLEKSDFETQLGKIARYFLNTYINNYIMWFIR